MDLCICMFLYMYACMYVCVKTIVALPCVQKPVFFVLYLCEKDRAQRAKEKAAKVK